MKGKDLKTLETFLAEYGLTPGPATSVSNQKTGGITNKTVANNPIKTALGGDKPVTPPVAAKKVDPGTIVNDPEGKEFEIIAPVGVPGNPDTVVGKDKNSGEYVTIDPNRELAVKETELKEWTS